MARLVLLILLSLLASSYVSADDNIHHRSCGSHNPGPALLEWLFHRYNQSLFNPTHHHVQKRDRYNVGTYITIITTDAKRTPATWKAMADQQLAVLNDKFAGASISFYAAAPHNIIQNTPDGKAVTGNDFDNLGKKYRKGGYGSLNIFAVSDLGGGNLGKTSFPTTGSNSGNWYKDYCYVLAECFPGGSYNGYDKGYTAVHEVGHWFGLQHTFAGQPCTEPNDNMADTPAESGAHYGCDNGADTCRSMPGLDPIHNFMEYTPDACMSEFTNDQKSAMNAAFKNFRLGK